MSGPVEQRGRCLCGAVKVRVTAPLGPVTACHCAACRRVTGGGPGFGAAVAKSAVIFEGGDHIAVYRSSDHAERGFCRSCGSSLFFRMAGAAASHNLSLCPGLLDDASGLELGSEMFIDEKPCFYALEGTRPRITAAEAARQLAAFLARRRAGAEASS